MSPGLRHWRVRLADGAHAAVTSWPGPGPRIVALHGLAHAGAVWSGFATAVERRAQVLAVDLRGHGDSDRDPTGLYRLETLVQDALAVLQSLGQHLPIILLGHSLGGRIVAEVALRDLAPVTAAVVVDTSPRPPEAWLAHLARIHAGPPARPATLGDYLRELSQMYPLAEPGHLRPLAVASVRPGVDGVTERVDRAALKVWSTNRAPSSWPERTGYTPLTLVRGAASSVLTRAVAAQLVAAHQVDELVEVARSGHGVPLENPAALAEAVLAVAISQVGPR
ncbi:MAG TPA: alpha/beta fold hydrolase [Acidimicrobiales bacterium]|nr:alpha/beta fold hydrolase [Acidimicrobiales bacterium]